MGEGGGMHRGGSMKQRILSYRKAPVTSGLRSFILREYRCPIQLLTCSHTGSFTLPVLVKSTYSLPLDPVRGMYTPSQPAPPHP